MITLARAIWRLPRAPGAARRVWRDWVLVGVLTALALLEGALRSDVPWILPSLVLEVALLATLLWRRTHPGLVVVVAFASTAVLDLLRQIGGLPPADLYSSAFVLILLYALARWGSGRELLLGGLVIVIGLLRPFVFSPTEPADLVGGAAVVVFPIALGAVIRYRDVVRIERLEQVRVHERERIARDLHDTVAHHVTAIALRSQAGLATAATDPAAAIAALQAVQAEASVTLREMRSLVGVLRDEGTDLRSPRPGVDDLRALGDTADGARYVLSVDGELDSVPAPTVTALYRIAQEAVTNARKHAATAQVIDVAVSVQVHAVAVRIHDDGPASARRGEGFGIRGMIERADLLGGVCTAGPGASGGWTVQATLPIVRGTE